jgi:hypothetical protein
MVVSRRAMVAMGGVCAGAGLLTALVVVPGLAGSALAEAASTGACSATAHIDSQWGTGTAGGQIVAVTVVNTSATPSTRWTVTWPLVGGQRVVSGWSAAITTSSGIVTATNLAYNGRLAPNGSATFGMQLAGAGPAPTLTCANDAAPQSPSPSPPQSSAPPTGADVTVAIGDNQRTVTLLVGQTLGVSLSSDHRPPATSGSGLTQLSMSGGYPTGQPLTAVYRAVTPGLVDVSSQTDYACLHASPPCAVPIALWTVHVKVVNTPPSDSGQTITVTTADNTRAISLRVGDTLVVSLPSMYTPTKVSSSAALAQRDVVGGYPTGQPLVARYLAVAQGTVDVSSISDAACNHQPTPCPSPQVPWIVHVTVTN